jgi:hypothetical protein
MESNRFDSFTKSLATWTSRRRVLAGLSALAASPFVLRQNRTAAQTSTPTTVDYCASPNGQAGDKSKLIGAAQHANTKIQNVGDFPPLDPGSTTIYSAQFQRFVKQIRCLLSREANSDGLSDDELRPLLNESSAIVSAMSIAFADDKQQLAFAAQPEVRALLAAGGCDALGCLARHLADESKCESNCGDDACINACQSTFFGDVIGGADGTDPKQSCLNRLYQACGPDCCAGSCVCGNC